MTTQTFFVAYKARINQNNCIYLPDKFREWIEAQEGDEIEIQCALGKHGQFLFVSNAKQQRKWKREHQEG